jgi:hypothetical protein
MNTREEMRRLTVAVAVLLRLPTDTVLNAQLDLATEYRAHLVATEWLASDQDAELLATLPAFWSWWRQRWANRDQVVLANVPADVPLKWQEEELYRAYHGPAIWGQLYPNDVVMEEFNTAKRDQRQAYQTLKQLFKTT